MLKLPQIFVKRKDEKISHLCYGVELLGNIQFEGTLKIEGKIKEKIKIRVVFEYYFSPQLVSTLLDESA